jgi:hypothetical protein
VNVEEVMISRADLLNMGYVAETGRRNKDLARCHSTFVMFVSIWQCSKRSCEARPFCRIVKAVRNGRRKKKPSTEISYSQEALK